MASRLHGGNPRLGHKLAALAAVGGVTLADIATAKAYRANRHRARPYCDYSLRSGFPKPPEQMRGIARNFKEKRGPHRITQGAEKQAQAAAKSSAYTPS